MGIDAALISGQVYPRLFDFIVLNSLVMVTSALAKFAGDLRILQSPLYGEWSEPFGNKQVGSSAMPFKKILLVVKIFVHSPVSSPLFLR